MTINEYHINEKFNYFAVAGNIGAGKTTLTERLASDLRIQPFFEPVKENPYLADFYSDMEKWSFHLQVFFLTERFKAQAKIQKENIWCVQDRTIYEDIEIFARTQYLVKAMSKRDYQTYSTLSSNITPFLKLPGKLIYLKASVNTLMERIHHRKRDYEKNMDRSYIELLNSSYNQWISKFSSLTEIITIDIDQVDLINNETAYDRILNQLAEVVD